MSPSTPRTSLSGGRARRRAGRTESPRTAAAVTVVEREWTPWPVTPRLAAEASPAELRRVDLLARRLLAAEPGLPMTDGFGPRLKTGALRDAPCLHLHDVLGPTVVPGHPDLALEMRAFALARDGDLVLVSEPPPAAFLDYCRKTLRLGRVTPVVPSSPPRGVSLAARFLRDGPAFARVVRRVRAAGGVTLSPYAGTTRAWSVAGALAERSRAPVSVAAPPPALGRRVNDKLWFSRVVEELLGSRSEPPTCGLHDRAHLAVRVRELSGRFERLAIKLPAKAGALGNVVIDSSAVRGRSLTEVHDLLARLLEEQGWGNPARVLLTAWEHPVLVSPSVQLWVPRLEGPGASSEPVVEGVFDQDLVGSHGAFGGCRPTALPASRQGQIAHESSLLARLFQRLGYYGRCSFDAILVGKDPENAALHWVECNGRWGGTSIPMTLAERLVGDWARRPFVVVHRENHAGRGRPFGAALEALGPRLLRAGPGDSSGGVALLSSFGVERGSSVDLVAFAATVEEAAAEAERAVALVAG